MKSMVLLIALSLLAANIGATDWTKWRGTDGKGISNEKNWKPDALNTKEVKWRAQVGKGWAIATVKGNHMYTMGHDEKTDYIHCLDRNSGKIIWTHKYPSETGRWEGPSATPIYDNGKIYTISKYGAALCLDAKTGKVVWAKDLVKEFDCSLPRWGYSSSFVVDGNTLLLNICKNGIALNKKTGARIWGSPGTKCGYATPVIYNYKGKKEALFFGENALYSVNIKNGKISWQYTWETSYGVNAADPIVTDGKIFISSGYGRGCSLIDISSGKPVKVWETKDLANHFGTSVLYKGYIYGPHGNTKRRTSGLSCIDIKTGKTVWFEKMGFNSVMLVSDKLVIQKENGELIIAEASPEGFRKHSGKQVFQDMKRTVCWTAPLFLDGHIYSRSSNGEFICIDMR